MFHAFHVVIDHVIGQAEQLEKVGQKLVTAGDVARERLASGGQDEAAVFLILEQALGVEALDHVGHTRLADAEAAGDVHDAGVALGVDEFEDALQVIFYRGTVTGRGRGSERRAGNFAGHGSGVGRLALSIRREACSSSSQCPPVAGSEHTHLLMILRSAKS